MRPSALCAVVLLAAACGGPASGGGADGGGASPDGSADPDSGERATPDASVPADATPDPDGGTGDEQCLFEPPPGEFNPERECAWDGPAEGSLYPNKDDVVSAPVVINLTDDNDDGEVDLSDVPDIAFISYDRQEDGCCDVPGVLRVVSGGCQDGTLVEHYSVGPDEIEADLAELGFDVTGVSIDNSGGLAAGDIDSDGDVEIVATVLNGGTIAFSRQGDVEWYQPDHPEDGVDHQEGSQPSIADVDGDGNPEIVNGRVILRGADGSLKARGEFGLGTNGFLGPVSTLGDIDLDGELEILAGNSAYDARGNELWTFVYDTPIDSSNCENRGFPCDGFTATGNFDDDDEGEVVIARAGTIYILNHDGTEMQVGGEAARISIPVDDCGKNEGGPPTVADFDGDGDAEIGVAGADFYVVADLECLGDSAPDFCTDPGIRWKVPNFDCSSRVTGSSVFDFEGDGRAEVVYVDEQNFYILDGVDGTELRSIASTSHTRLELPIVVDVDNDGNAEVVYAENGPNGSPGTPGIRVIGDDTDTWVPTRRVWNQHSYHVSNVSELGAIPSPEPPNWLEPTDATTTGVMNVFRQNLPSSNAFAAPDLSVSLDIDAPACSIAAEVCNDGDIVVGAGVAVDFYDNDTETEIPCEGAPLATAEPLEPGACEVVECIWDDDPPVDLDARACVDNDGYECASGAAGANNECDEGNNADDATGAAFCEDIIID